MAARTVRRSARYGKSVGIGNGAKDGTALGSAEGAGDGSTEGGGAGKVGRGDGTSVVIVEGVVAFVSLKVTSSRGARPLRRTAAGPPRAAVLDSLRVSGAPPLSSCSTISVY